MSKFHSQRGFSLIETIIIVVVVLLIVGAGYFVYTRQQNEVMVENTTPTSSDPARAGDVAEAPEINDRSDLDAAERALEANDPELSNDDMAQLEQELDQL